MLEILECQITQPFRSRTTGDDSRATLHHDLETRRVVRFDGGHVFKVDEVGAMNSEKIPPDQSFLEIGQPHSDQELLFDRVNCDIVIAGLDPFHARQLNGHYPIAIPNENSRKGPCVLQGFPSAGEQGNFGRAQNSLSSAQHCRQSFAAKGLQQIVKCP